MRVLIVCDAMAAGGTEILTANLANELNARGVDVTLFILPRPKALDLSALKYLDKGINYLVFPRKIALDVTIFSAIREKYIACRPDVVLCQAMFSFYCFSLATLFLKKHKTFLVLHYTKNIKLKDEISDWLYFVFVRLFKIEFIAVYRKQIELFSNKYLLNKKNFHVIYTGININHFSPGLNENKDEFIRILHVANMREEKDEKTLVESLVVFNNFTKNWRAVFCGRDLIGIKKRLIVTLKENRIEDKVRFIDYEADVRILLRETDVFVLSSISEALPVSALEAMAMGVPCILTDVGGCADIIDDGINGFLVPPKNAKTIADKLVYFASHRDVLKEMGGAARKKVEATFKIDLMTDNYLKLFAGVTK